MKQHKKGKNAVLCDKELDGVRKLEKLLPFRAVHLVHNVGDNDDDNQVHLPAWKAERCIDL